MLLKTRAYVKGMMMEKLNGLIFFTEDNELFETYNDIWNKVSYSVKQELDCEPIYNIKFLKTKMRSYGHEGIDFHVNETPKVDFTYTCLAVILTDFVLKNDENYYPQEFLKE